MTERPYYVRPEATYVQPHVYSAQHRRRSRLPLYVVAAAAGAVMIVFAVLLAAVVLAAPATPGVVPGRGVSTIPYPASTGGVAR